jgi:hypothetical protein
LRLSLRCAEQREDAVTLADNFGGAGGTGCIGGTGGTGCIFGGAGGMVDGTGCIFGGTGGTGCIGGCIGGTGCIGGCIGCIGGCIGCIGCIGGRIGCIGGTGCIRPILPAGKKVHANNNRINDGLNLGGLRRQGAQSVAQKLPVEQRRVFAV